jgi:hypothetical protein
MSSANIIQLRQLLSEKFPGLRMRLDETPAVANFWPTGLPQIDEPSGGGLPKGALTEIIAAKKSIGSASLLCALLARAAIEKQIIAVVDGCDSLEVTQIEESILSRLLWVRCRSAQEALKTGDLLLRDSNVSLVLLDLVSNPIAQLRKISPTTWYRFQRLVEQSATICVVFTPHSMVNPAQVRVTLRSSFSLDTLEKDFENVLLEMKMDVTSVRRAEEMGSVEHSA